MTYRPGSQRRIPRWSGGGPTRRRFWLSLPMLLGHRDRFPEEGNAADEERRPHGPHHQELAPDGAQAPAAIDDDLREAHEVSRGQEIGEVLQPLGLALDRGLSAREQRQHQDDKD